MYGRGHEQGTRQQRTPLKPWWAEQEAEHIKRIEAQWVHPGQADAVAMTEEPMTVQERRTV